MNRKSYKKLFSVFVILAALIVINSSTGFKFINKNNNNFEVEQNYTHNGLALESNELEIFKKTFLYKEKPVHPEIIERFMSFSMSDGWKPKTASMDIVACTNTNEFYKEFEWSKSEDAITCSLKRDDNAGCFNYEWLGKLDNGLHVIKTSNNGGGSGIFQDLIFFRISQGTALTPEGQEYSQILLTFVRNYCLGDRDEGEVKILNNKVTVGTSQYREEEVILDFPDNIDFN